MEPTSSVSTIAIVTHGTLAFFGAIVHAAKSYREGASKTWIDFLTLTVMSSFSGVMFALVGFYMFGESQQYLTMAMAGTGGFLGVEGMALIIGKLKGLMNK